MNSAPLPREYIFRSCRQNEIVDFQSPIIVICTEYISQYLYIEKNTLNNNENATAIFAALADPTRFKLVQLLSEQTADNAICVTALAMQLGVSQPAVSQHLGILKAAGLVESEKRSNYMHYFVKPGTLERCQKALATALQPSSQVAAVNLCLDKPCAVKVVK